MRKFLLCAACTAVMAVVTGCATVVVEGPAGEPVKLANTGKTLTEVKNFKMWFMFWGLVSLGDNSTAQAIQEAKFKVVRVQTQANVDDLIMTLLGVVPIIPYSRTVYIYGE
jgi:hypothetical protein